MPKISRHSITRRVIGILSVRRVAVMQKCSSRFDGISHVPNSHAKHTAQGEKSGRGDDVAETGVAHMVCEKHSTKHTAARKSANMSSSVQHFTNHNHCQFGVHEGKTWLRRHLRVERREEDDQNCTNCCDHNNCQVALVHRQLHNTTTRTL